MNKIVITNIDGSNYKDVNIEYFYRELFTDDWELITAKDKLKNFYSSINLQRLFHYCIRIIKLKNRENN